MALTLGTRLGAYEILALLGSGGMGDVYRARDTRLDRTVAIKVLRESIAADPQRRERFEREARTISILIHPHICTLHDIGHQGGIDYLVMELLDGETLAGRLAKGALPLDQALEYAVEIANALETAHRHGIVHRDLKPANVMLTKAGAKLFDFGIAKAVALGGAATTLTAEGTLLGTLQYMAPEQLEGRDADTRSDLFAFGAVLYEMLTGRRAFPGESQSQMIAAVLDSEPPPIDTTQPQAPPVLKHIVKTLLAKNPDERWQSTADLTRALRWTSEKEMQATADPAGVRTPRIRPRLTTALLALAGVAIAGWIVFLLPQRRQGPSEVRFTIEPPPMANPFQVSVSPDGRQVAFVASSSDGVPRLFVRPIDSTTLRPLPGTEYALQPFWSPDSRSIGFGTVPQVGSSGAKLKRVEVTGGPVQFLCDVGIPFFGGTWNSSGVIVFSSGGRLYRSSAEGGAPTPIRSPGPSTYSWPHFLPDGLHYLFTATAGRNRVVYVASLNSDEPKRLMPAESMVAYAPPGVLLFLREGTLVAQRFDQNRLEIRGEPVSLADGILFNTVNGRAAFAVSDNGTLAYRTGSGSTESWRWQWMDRAGNVVPVGTSLASQSLRLSPDGKHVAFSERADDAAAEDIWIYDVDRNVRTRLTNDQAQDHWPAWSPDGSRVVFDSPRMANQHVLYEKPANGAIAERVLLQPEPGMSYGVLDWSLDGRFILFGKTAAAHRAPASPPGDVWVLPVFGDEKPFPYPAPSFGGQAALSPNGRWLAYTSDETGRAQVVVQPFPDPSGGRWQVSRAGAAYPRWRRDGRELYYVENNALVALSVTTASGFEFGKSMELFQGLLLPPTFIAGPAYPYDVTADGQRFLVSSLAAPRSGSPITIVLNWTERLNR